jgi:myxalamid-type polyketide synthase MxaE and MxaD/epothilone polyketide synthase C/epothilone polyketide synthase D
VQRVALPTYPFARERHWVAPSAAAAPRTGAPRTGHPLLGEPIELAGSPGTHVWQAEVSLETHPWLDDHRVQDAVIVPATAYIEMAFAAGGAVLRDGSLVVREIENLKPLILHQGVSHTVQAALVVEDDGRATFTVHSRPRATNARRSLPWTAHVSALVEASECESRPALSFDELRARCTRRVDGPTFYGALARKGNQWGPAFQGLEEVWVGDGEAVGKVRVAPMLAGDVSRYRFHPAVSDACGHTLVATVPLETSGNATGGAFVGGGVGEIRFHASPRGGTLWVHARLRAMPNGSGQVVVGDVFVHDESGALVTETLDARLWYLEDGADAAPADWFYDVRWEAAPLEGPGPRRAGDGAWVVFADRGGAGERIAEQLAALRTVSGERTLLISRGDAPSMDGNRAVIRPGEPADYRAVIEAVGTPAAVVDLWSLDSADAPANVEHAVRVLQGVLAARGHPKPRLWLVTRDSQAVAAGDGCDSFAGAALWGVGRSLSAEHAELWGGLFDLAADVPDETAGEALAREIEAGAADDMVALRRDGRFVRRLARRAAHAPPVHFAPSPDGTWLVTGGLGGIGLAAARWLVERGARHLLLLGRTPLPPRTDWAQLDPTSAAGRRVAAVAALEAAGAKVEVTAVDIAAAGALERCLSDRRARGEPPVRGVFHAAGVLHFQPLASQDGAAIRAQLAAKVDGALRLHELLAGEPLEGFISCSSTSALLASPLLGAYAAGNAFLDALAHHRRARGLPALSVNWGTWGEVGMAVEAGRSASGDMLAGVGTIPTGRGLAALESLLAAGAVQSAVMPVDWQTLGRSYPQFASDRFLSQLVGAVAPAVPGASGNGVRAAALRAAADGERPALARDYLRAEAARALGMRADRLDTDHPLSSLGFDSLMAVQLKNQIANDLGVVLPMILFLQGPSVDELVPAVLEALADGTQVAAGVADGAAAADDWEEGSL